MPETPYLEADLFQFSYGSVAFRYNNGSSTIVTGGRTYLPYPLKRTEVSASQEEARNSLTISADRMFPIAKAMLSAAPTSVIDVTLLNYNRQGSGTTSLLWSGRLASVTWNETDVVEMLCEPSTVSRNRNGLFRRYSKMCSHALYDSDTCKLNRASYAHTAAVSGISGNLLTVSSVGSYSYPGGYASFDNGTYTETRMIVSASGTTLNLLQPFAGLAVSDTVILYPGCDRTVTACTGYGNILNYGGWPYMKSVNPFDSQIGPENNSPYTPYASPYSYTIMLP